MRLKPFYKVKIHRTAAGSYAPRIPTWDVCGTGLNMLVKHHHLCKYTIQFFSFPTRDCIICHPDYTNRAIRVASECVNPIETGLVERANNKLFKILKKNNSPAVFYITIK